MITSPTSPPHQSPVTTTENRRIARAAGLVSGLTLLSRVGGLIRDAVVGYYFGAGTAADAFFVAFRIPNLLRRLVAEGAMNVAFIPVFADSVANRSAAETARAARALGTVMSLVLAALTVAGIVWAPLLTAVFAPGFAADPAKLALTVTLTRIVFPYLFLIGLVALSGGVLNAYRHFAVPAGSPILLNLGIIGAAILLASHVQQPVYALAYGVLFGGALQLAVQLPPLLRHGVRPLPRWQPGHPAVRRVLWLMLPTLFGAATHQVTIALSTILASVLPSGSVSYLWYATRVFDFPVGLFAVALGTAALPSFSTQAARGAYAELAGSVSFALRLTNLIAVPAMVGMFCLARPITAVLFQRGAFGAHDVDLTASALSALAAGLWALSIARVLVPAFYALHDARTPVLTGAVALVANVLGSLMLMGAVPVSAESGLAAGIGRLSGWLAIADLRHAGLALASSLAAIVNAVLLAAMLRRRLAGVRLAPVVRSLWQSAVASAAMVWPVRWIAGAVDWVAPGDVMLKAGALSAAIAVGVMVYGAVALLLGADDVRLLLRTARGRAAAVQ